MRANGSLVTRVIALVFIACFATTAQAYDAPTGIPTPPFGIDETRPPHPADWPASPECRGLAAIEFDHRSRS